MSKRMSWITLVILLVASLVLAACAQPPAPTQAPAPAKTEAPAATEAPVVTEAPAAGEPVTLTFGSWRPDDTKQMEVILAEFTKEYPNITIKWDPTNPPDYDAAVRTQMESGTGNDLYYLRTKGAGTSHTLYNEGHFLPIDGLPGLDNIIPEAIENWTADDGKVFGVGYISTSEGIYYNKDLLTQLGITEPTSWEDLMAAAQKIKDAGYVPFANASGDSWTIATLLLQNWIPSVIGGVDGRMAYFNGEKCLNDADFVQAFKQVQDLAPFLPEGWEALTYYDSQQLWLQGKAAMWLGGSWDIPAFETEAPAFQWGVMPVPPANDKPQYVEWELDAGVGINSATKHPEEAKTFLSWLTTKKSAELLAGNLPGFFPMTKDQITTDNPYANAFMDIKSKAKGADIRFYMSGPSGAPDSTSLFIDNGIAVLKGEKTPEQAAQAVYDGISSWNDAQKNCKP